MASRTFFRSGPDWINVAEISTVCFDKDETACQIVMANGNVVELTGPAAAGLLTYLRTHAVPGVSKMVNLQST